MMASNTPPLPRIPTPPEQPASGSGGVHRARRMRHSADDVLALAREQCVAPGLAHAIASHEAARKAGSSSGGPSSGGLSSSGGRVQKRPPRRHSSDSIGSIHTLQPLPSPGKRTRGQFVDEAASAEQAMADWPSASDSLVPMWGGPELQLPSSPRPHSSSGAGRPAALSHLLPSPSPALLAQKGFGSVSTGVLPSPFSPTKKLRAMTLRSTSLNPVMEAEPRKPGELLSTTQHRLRQAYQLWDVHTGMGGAAGAAFAAILKREFPSVSATEIIEIQSAIAARDRVGKIKEQVASRAWSEVEKKQVKAMT